MNNKEPQDYGLGRQDVGNNEADSNRESELSNNADIDFSASIPKSIDLERVTTAAICAIEVLSVGNYRYIDLNPVCEVWLNATIEELKGKSPREVFGEENIEVVLEAYDRCVRSQEVTSYEEYILIDDRRSCWITTLKPLINSEGKVYRLISTSVDISVKQQIEAEIAVQASRVKLLSAIALKIRQSLNLSTILQQTVDEVRSFLATDRVLLYGFDDLFQGSIVVESIASPWNSILGRDVRDPCFTSELIHLYYHGKIQVIEDVAKAELSSCYRELLDSCQVKANSIFPIVTEKKLWGLLIAQHCRTPRQWQQANIELLKQVATMVGIAVQQAELHQRVQNLSSRLEEEVEQRTFQLRSALSELQKALQSAELVRTITKAIRDSLDEKQILQTATRSLAEGLAIECCQIELYKYNRTITEVIHEYPIVLPDDRGIHRQVDEYPELYKPLLAKQSLHFVDWLPTIGFRQQQVSRLVCPIFDDRGILGNIWLMRPREMNFELEEIKLIEQIADQCAIAIRQARLYATEQIQVEELEKLNVVKDDFLKTISHELRTPMSRLRLAISTLENLLEVEFGGHNSARIAKVMEIFHSSFKKQNQLIDDLLTLCYVDASSKPDSWQLIDLKSWIPQVVKTFSYPVAEQELVLDLADDLPPLHSDSKMLKRIVDELLKNAAKYTPPEGKITISTEKNASQLLLKVVNTGVEIPLEEQERIFDKFYRIPNSDPWQHGGTGIGLALVKKLVELLEGEIMVSSQLQTTIFTLAFALN